MGKSTLINSLFLTDLYRDRKLLNAEGESSHLHLKNKKKLQYSSRHANGPKPEPSADHRAHKPNGRDHQTHGRHRREGSKAQADHRGHTRLWGRRQQQRVVSYEATHETDTVQLSSDRLELVLMCVCMCMCMPVGNRSQITSISSSINTSGTRAV